MQSFDNAKIVCLGGGIGTSNLIKGLKIYNPRLTVITSMADDGGSSGRLRKAYGIMPPGDIVSCIAALIPSEQKNLSELLTYRFKGKIINNKSIEGHKLGNLIMLALIQQTGDINSAIALIKDIFNIKAQLFPATSERTRLSAITKDGRRVHSETTLDLAKYSEPYGLKKIYLTPKQPKVGKLVLKSISEADIIISGPGDLYTNQLPVLIIPQIRELLFRSDALKVFVINTANKPFETKGFLIKDFILCVNSHLFGFPFNYILANNNFTNPIPKQVKYTYVASDSSHPDVNTKYKIIFDDLVNRNFPIYHDPDRLASAIAKLYNCT